MEQEYPTQLRMVWPESLLDRLPVARLAAGYALRTYQPGDEERFYRVMASAGWPDWNTARLQPWQERILPDGWFMAVHQASGEIAASAMALRDQAEFGSPGGEVGWVACAVEHRGRGLGMAVSAAVTERLIAARYRHIHLYTEDWRLAALKIYLKLGYVPLLYAPDMEARWRSVYAQLQRKE